MFDIKTYIILSIIGDKAALYVYSHVFLPLNYDLLVHILISQDKYF